MTSIDLNKKFSLNEESMYDLNTYIGRLKHFFRVTDMRLICLTENKIENLKNKLKDFESNPEKYDTNIPKINKELWAAKYGIKSSINAETGKIIPTPARMCAFVPMNLGICFGLICAAPTTTNIIMFNLINQTYNAMMNYANGSGTEDSIKYTTISYGLAVVSSISTGLILKRLFDRKKSVNIISEGLIRVLPSSVAGFLNLFFMRSDYFTKGISIKDEKGNHLGVSKNCGIKAVVEGGFTRMLLPLPLFINHFLIKYLAKMNLNRKFNLTIELSLCAIALAIGLPCSIAMFKEIGTYRTIYLEEDLKKDLRDIEFVYYNKGL